MRCIAYGLVLTSVFTVACQRAEQQAAEQKPVTATVAKPEDAEVVTQSKLGSKVGADGNVTDRKASFKRSEPIYLSMWLKESPAGLFTSVRWFDGQGKLIAEESKPMNGAKVATFKLGVKKPKAGSYRAVAYWGGSIAAEYDFKITK